MATDWIGLPTLEKIDKRELNRLGNWRIFAAFVLIGCFVVFVVATFRWYWMGDAQVFHYTLSFNRAGMSPYRQILDINMPGSYLSEFAGMSLFGASDVGWRLYDFSLLISLAGAMISISFLYDWYAGLYRCGRRSVRGWCRGSEG